MQGQFAARGHATSFDDARPLEAETSEREPGRQPCGILAESSWQPCGSLAATSQVIPCQTLHHRIGALSSGTVRSRREFVTLLTVLSIPCFSQNPVLRDFYFVGRPFPRKVSLSRNWPLEICTSDSCRDVILECVHRQRTSQSNRKKFPNNPNFWPPRVKKVIAVVTLPQLSR